MPRGFHDITLVDMTGMSGPTVSMGEMRNLQRQWPTSLLTGMTRRQTDLELMRNHVSLGLGTVVAVPGVVVFTLEGNSPGLYWPYLHATPRGCLSENRQSGEMVPAWTVTRSVWNAALKPNVSGISTVQRTWGPAGPPLPGVRRVYLPWLSSWDFHGRAVGFH